MDTLYLDCYLSIDCTSLSRILELNRTLVEMISGSSPPLPHAGEGRGECGSIVFARENVPHLTLYMGLFPVRNESLLLERIAALAGRFPPPELRFQGFSASPEGHLFLDLEPSPALSGLHRAVVGELNPLREGATREKYRTGLGDYSLEEQENIREFGFPWVMGIYRPHVTIGFSSRERPGALAERLGEATRNPAQGACFTGLGEALGLGPVGEHGVVIRPGNTFPLTGIRTGDS